METLDFMFGLFRLDAKGRILTKGRNRVHLTKKALKVLQMLLEHPGETVFKEILIEKVWGESEDKGNYLEQKICELRGRKVFDDDPNDPKFISTEHGEGYKFIAPIKRVAPNEQIDGDISDEQTLALAATAEEGRVFVAEKVVPIRYFNASLSGEEAPAKSEVIPEFSLKDFRRQPWTLDLSDDAIAQIKANSTQPKTRRVEFRSRVDQGQRTWTML